MVHAVDQTLDFNGQEIHRIVSLYGAPDFVKNASRQEWCGDESTAPHMFADMTRRNYPCHTAAATWLSSAFFLEKKAELTPVRAKYIGERITESARFFKIATPVAQLEEKIARTNTYNIKDLPDDAFAVVFTNNDGEKERHLPMRNAKEVVKAAAYLVKHRDAIPFDDKRVIADRIMVGANQFGADIREHRYVLEKCAGMGVCAGDDVAALLKSRVYAIGHTRNPSPLQTEMYKIASVAENAPNKMHHYDTLIKLAGMIDQFDREHGLVKRYSTDLQRPEDVLFAVTEKVAAELTDELIGNTLTGNYYKRADLQRAPVKDLSDALGEDFAARVSTANAWPDTTKLARIIPTLPLGDAELFDAVMANAGIAPCAQKSASAKRFSAAEQVKLASAHQAKPGSLWARVLQ